MMAASHRLGGIAAGVVMADLFPQTDMTGKVILVSAAVLGSLIPDIDNERSSISRRFRGVSLLVSIVQTLGRALASLFPSRQEKYIRGAIGHRGLSHSLLMAAAAIGVIRLGASGLPQWGGMIELAAWGVGAGIVSHLILDLFAGGVPLLFPFTLRRVTLAHIKTGGVVEWLVRMAAAAVIAAVVGNDVYKYF